MNSLIENCQSIHITFVNVNGLNLVLEPPLDLHVIFGHQMFVVADTALGIFAYTEMLEDLHEEVCNNLAFLYRTYVEAQLNELAPDAISLRENLSSHIRKVE